MNFDFSLILFIATIVTGIIWGIDKLFFYKKRMANGVVDEKSGELKEPILVEYSRFLFPVVLVVFLLRGFIAEPFRIPSGSMLPTLEIGDFILVNKFSYGVRLPVFEAKLLEFDNPQRGDVIVFRYPENPSINYIKRVVGVPGDEIAYYNKVLFVNGDPVSLEAKGEYQAGFPNTQRFVENLAGTSHDILHDTTTPARDFVIKIPDEKYLVLGDNRDNSKDSRYWGFVPDENLVGKAFVIWMNWDFGNNWPDWSRIGTIIK